MKNETFGLEVEFHIAFKIALPVLWHPINLLQ